jgi:type II restriction/modification system DNA methylase subunit YeeA
MDKNAIKKYAVWARRELIARVSQKALQYGISAKETGDAAADSVNDKLLTDTEKKQRQALIAQINEKGFELVCEEIAYTWFNRFSALRFMEVNGYLPTHVRVFTDEENNFKPQILTEAIHLEMDGLDMDKVYAYKEADQTEELYKYLLITQCNALNKILPGMFQRIVDYTELLFPDNLLREGSVIEQMIAMIPEEDWQDAVQIIGWLYQYYNSEPKDTVFANLKKNIKISKEDIPAATQLFTPDWIVRYMVENSLGRLWLEGHPNDGLKAGWKYYLDEAEQEAEVQAQLAKIREEYQKIKPEEIRCIDPCMGSGHILVYMFDVLMQIYEAYGYNQREAAASIVENNLFGLDIDERAAQLAYFAVMIKARQYDRRFFSREVQPHVYAIRESNHLDNVSVEYFVNGDAKLKADLQTLMDELCDAKEYGSILNVSQVDFDALYARFDEIRDEISIMRETLLNELLPFVQVAQTLVQKYDVVVTNPPYMGKGMSTALSKYLKKHYDDSKADLFSAFIEKCCSMAASNGYWAMITQHSWMFLSSYEKLRQKLLEYIVVNMCHLGARAFEEIGGEVVQTTTFVYKKIKAPCYQSRFVRLLDYQSQKEKEQALLNNASKNTYVTGMDKLSTIEGIPFAYWVSKTCLEAFQNNNLYGLTISDGQNKTGDNDTYLREHWEVEKFNVGVGKKWLHYAKGGSYRKWAGNLYEVIDWSGLARQHYRADPACRILKEYLWYKKGITWGIIAQIGFRVLPCDATFDMQGSSVFISEESEYSCILAFLNSKVAYIFLQIFNTTLSFQIRDIRNLPYNKSAIALQKKEIECLSETNVNLATAEWDSFETSWDFMRHPIVQLCHGVTTNDGHESAYIEDAYNEWEFDCNERFNQLKANEEELNRIFIDIYGLQDELTPEVEDKDVTVRKADLQRDIKSLISYAVGCMFGRYSLDVDGLAYAGGDWDDSKYKKYPADKDNIIPICDDEYFPDDIVGRFVKFIETVYGTDTLEENLQFIAAALGGKETPREVIRNYFLNDFYTDHCKIYQKRPIYWLFDSGKKNGFKALIYLHRYQPDTLARMRTDYVHEQQARYRTAIENLEQRINGAATADRVKLNKQLTKLREQAEELRLYEEKIHHLADRMIRIDLDDGVKHNYEIFKDVLANIK